jgi:hypothetical protein
MGLPRSHEQGYSLQGAVPALVDGEHCLHAAKGELLREFPRQWNFFILRENVFCLKQTKNPKQTKNRKNSSK